MVSARREGLITIGTRCDFYVGRGPDAEWLGSTAWDGNPGAVFEGAPEMLAEPLPTEAEWRHWVSDHLASRDDGTTPDLGWPWPWNDSRTTDYAYAWEDGRIYGSRFGYEWFRLDPEVDFYGQPDLDQSEKVAVFPDMTDRKDVTWGKRSGVTVFGFGGAE